MCVMRRMAGKSRQNSAWAPDRGHLSPPQPSRDATGAPVRSRTQLTPAVAIETAPSPRPRRRRDRAVAVAENALTTPARPEAPPRTTGQTGPAPRGGPTTPPAAPQPTAAPAPP